MQTRIPRPHWIDVEVAGVVRGYVIDETVRVYVRKPEFARNTKAIRAAAIREVKARCGFHPCVSSTLFETGLRDWSDSVDAATDMAPECAAAVAEIISETGAA